MKATLEAQYTRTAKLLEKQNLDYNQFCEDNGLKRLSDRIQIAKWTRGGRAEIHCRRPQQVNNRKAEFYSTIPAL